VLDKAFAFLGENPPRWLNLTGIGEITVMPEWVRAVERFVALVRGAGAGVGLTSNFNKLFDDNEIDLLLSLSMIQVSVDTDDPGLLRQIRVKADLRNITLNLVKLRAAALRRGIAPPHLRFNVVVTNRNWQKLADLAAFALAVGINSLFLIQLNDNSFFNNKAAVERIGRLSDEAFTGVARQITEAATVMESHGGRLILSEELSSHIVRRLSGDEAAEGVPAGMTRICTQLWDFGVIKEDGRISHCCANLRSEESVLNVPANDIMNGERIRGWRRALLTGQDLIPECAQCHWAAVGPVEKLVQIVRDKHRRRVRA
jgi:hypothetical protein